MHRITISLPDELADMLEREAHRRGKSVSAVVRQAVVADLGLSTDKPTTIRFAGLGRSGRRHTARNAEKILAREWARVRDR